MQVGDWVFKRKKGIPRVEPARYKSKLVAKGFTQRDGVDFNEIFSPVVKHSSIRISLSIVAHFEMELEQMDVKTTFLHGNLEEKILMRQPVGYEASGKEDRVCLLKKSLYGLKQSPRQWYKRFDNFMLSSGYQRSKYDNCVYLRKTSEGDYVYLLLYVDDMLLAPKNRLEINKLKLQLKSKFEIKDLGAAKRILGMEISRSRERSELTYLRKATWRNLCPDSTW